MTKSCPLPIIPAFTAKKFKKLYLHDGTCPVVELAQKHSGVPKFFPGPEGHSEDDKWGYPRVGGYKQVGGPPGAYSAYIKDGAPSPADWYNALLKRRTDQE